MSTVGERALRVMAISTLCSRTMVGHQRDPVAGVNNCFLSKKVNNKYGRHGSWVQGIWTLETTATFLWLLGLCGGSFASLNLICKTPAIVYISNVVMRSKWDNNSSTLLKANIYTQDALLQESFHANVLKCFRQGGGDRVEENRWVTYCNAFLPHSEV